jgi:hypothetical protein
MWNSKMLEKTCHNQDKLITGEFLQTDWKLQVGINKFIYK